MRKGKCIYCNQEKELNREHAFPKSLLQITAGAPEWIIDEHLCKECNSKLGKLDKILTMRGPIGHTWSLIKSEFGNENEHQQSLRYNQKCYGLEPDRMMVPEPVLENRIGLFKLLVENSENNTSPNSIENSLDPVVPQIILTLYAKWQQLEETRDETIDNFNSLDIIHCTDNDFKGSVYWVGNGKIITQAVNDSVILVPRLWIQNPNFVLFPSIFPPNATENFPFPHTYVFSQKATEHFFDRPKTFQVKFLRNLDWIRSDLTIIKDSKNKKHGKAKYFMKSIKANDITVVDKQIYLKDETYADISRLKTIQGRFATVGNAKLYIDRAIAKIGFHCFLYHYSDEFTGHEHIFDGIKSFIFSENTSNNFATENNDVVENSIYSSNTHFHNISFLREGQDIGCRIDLFTGLTRKPFSFNITLSGKIENWNLKPDKKECIPFYVSSRSDRKRRIHSPNDFEIIQKPSLDEMFIAGITRN